MLTRSEYRKISEKINILRNDIVNTTIHIDRETEIVLMKLEEAEMWLNKVGIR